MGVGDDKVRSFDLKPKDFVSESSFPFTVPPSQGVDEAASSVRKAFLSPGRMTDVASLFKINILQKVAPGLQKEGYEESAHAASQSAGAGRQPEPGGGRREGREAPPHEDDDPLRDDHLLPPLAQPRPYDDDPLASEPPRRPYPAGDFPPPGFEDEYEINRPPRGGMGGGGERRPLNIGERDLYPPGLGPHDPLRGGGGFGPGGGMHPTFDDPLFGGGRAGGGGYDGRYALALIFIPPTPTSTYVRSNLYVYLRITFHSLITYISKQCPPRRTIRPHRSRRWSTTRARRRTTPLLPSWRRSRRRRTTESVQRLRRQRLHLKEEHAYIRTYG